jgi:hypothetical protein
LRRQSRRSNGGYSDTLLATRNATIVDSESCRVVGGVCKQLHTRPVSPVKSLRCRRRLFHGRDAERVSKRQRDQPVCSPRESGAGLARTVLRARTRCTERLPSADPGGPLPQVRRVLRGGAGPVSGLWKQGLRATHAHPDPRTPTLGGRLRRRSRHARRLISAASQGLPPRGRSGRGMRRGPGSHRGGTLARRYSPPLSVRDRPGYSRRGRR